MAGCNQELVIDETESDPSAVIGQMAHIRGERPDAPRYDVSMTEDERRSHKNIILLCPTHHREIDAQPNSYPVDKLLKIKAAHEILIKEAIKTQVMNITFAELSSVIDFLVENKVAFVENNYTIIPPKEKIIKNDLSADIEYLITIGLLQVKQVQKYIENSLDPYFGERIKQGFVKEYQRLTTTEELKGDELFDSLWNFSSLQSKDVMMKAAGLTVLVYLFEKCEVFEK